MAITFTESIVDLGFNLEGDGRIVKLSATRTDDVSGVVVSASKSGVVKVKSDLNAMAVAVGDALAAKIPTATQKQTLLEDAATDFHTYLTGRIDLNG